jgi:Tol biopolymer transport system component
MTDLEQQLTDHLRRRADAAIPRYDLESIEQGISVVTVLDLDDHRPGRPTMRTLVSLAAALALVVAVLVAIAWRDDRKLGVDHNPSGRCCYLSHPVGRQVTGASAVLGDRWLAFASGRDGVSIVRNGATPRRVDLPGDNTDHNACPAFAPQPATLPSGAQRLMISRRAYGTVDGAAELAIVDVASDGSVTHERTISISDALGAVAGPAPCAIWSPDGSWAALAGAGSVWVVNMNSGEVRGLSGYHPTDLEWRPNTDELAFTGTQLTPTADMTDAPIDIYNVRTDEIRTVGAARATSLTWSPDGTTLAFTGGDNDGIWLVNADGTDERQLTEHIGTSNHGHGVIWSPDGRYIAYQRLIAGRGEEHEVVLVTATDNDARKPLGTERVIGPPNTPGPNGFMDWYPYDIIWSPDSTYLVYFAWVGFEGYGQSLSPRMIAVPIDGDGSPIVITDQLGLAMGSGDGTPWVPLQQWSQPIAQ